MKIFELLEARSNPQLNKKIITLDSLQQLSDQHPGIKLFVSFTSINKLGVNPSSTYHTPNGIYAYPLNYVLINYNKIPFASESKFAQVFSCNGKMFDIKNANLNEVEQIRKQVNQLSHINDDPRDIKYFEEIFQEYMTSAGDHKGSAVWWYIYRIASFQTQGQKPGGYITNKEGQQVPVRLPDSLKSAEIWRKLGYSGVIDYNTSTIHPNEPTQAVFFSLDKLNRIATLNNQIKKTDLKRKNTRNAGNYLQAVTTWDALDFKMSSGQLTKRLTPSVEKVLFDSPANTTDAHAMAVYARDFMNGGRLPHSCELILAQTMGPRLLYVKGKSPEVKREIAAMKGQL